jgi:ABC-type antimicrobial peptide transport system permease subunit
MSVVPAVRNAVLALDNQQPVNRIRTMAEIVAQNYGAIRFPMSLLWIFSALALLLSAVGIFGVTSYTVSQRTREMAIRLALGASHRELLRLVLREGLAVTLAGTVVGLAGTLLVSRLMKAYVYGISSTDPLTLTAACLVLAAIALLASYIPARRAARVDPMVALRYE